MSQTAQHEAKVKQLELELAKAKADLEAVGSLTSTSQIHQTETHLPIQQPLMLEMPEFQCTKEEEQPRPALGALDIREQMEQEIEDMPEGPAKEYLMYEKKVMELTALAFLQPKEQIKDFGSDFLPLPLMRHKANLWKEKMRPAVQRNEDGGYEGIPLTSEEAKTLIEDHPRVSSCWEIEMMASHCSAFYRDGRFCITHEMVPSVGKGLNKLPLVTFRKAKTPSTQAFAQKVVTSAVKVVVMVDPIEAKRLAVEQMKQLEAKAKFKRQRAIEAINGGFAMLGITGCLIIEGYTGKPILSQVAGYLHVLADIFDKYLPAAQL
ncbi:hypothetical protein L7F22_016389 [Adiantum nelumboides]|nr:hypothetical protein [Adiantum nelumboides]